MPRTLFKGKHYAVSHTLGVDTPITTRDRDYYQTVFVITALLQGSGDCFVEGNRHTLSAGDLVLLQPEELRCYRYAEGGVHERMTIYLEKTFLSYLWDQGYELSLQKIFRNHPLGVGNKIELTEEQRGKALAILRDIRDRMHADQATPDSLRGAEIHLLLLQLLMLLYRAVEDSVSAGNWNNDPAIRRVCQYIQKNLPQSLNHQCIMENCHVSRYQLSEVFPRSTGMTLTEYVLQKRLIKVAELVRRGAGIEQAAVEAGFHNYSHFYKEFVKHKGVSPRKYFKK